MVGIVVLAAATSIAAFAIMTYGAWRAYGVACPPAKALRAVVQMAQCNGVMTVSPIVPGLNRFEFT